MATVRLHAAEADRLDSLASYHVPGTAPDTAFDGLTALAAQVCNVPLAMVNVVDADHQLCRSMHGVGSADGLWALPREMSFCSDMVAQGVALVIPDADLDSRYRDNPHVGGESGVRAYTGVPLIGRDGLPLGSICVFDWRPRRFTGEQLAGLTTLATQVVALLEQRRRDITTGRLADGIVDDARDPVRLRLALDRGEPVPHFQVVVDIPPVAASGPRPCCAGSTRRSGRSSRRHSCPRSRTVRSSCRSAARSCTPPWSRSRSCAGGVDGARGDGRERLQRTADPTRPGRRGAGCASTLRRTGRRTRAGDHRSDLAARRGPGRGRARRAR